MTESGEAARTSVVIATHNSGARIAELLAALASDPDGPDEVVVVDNASTDDTAAAVAGYDVRWCPLDRNRGFGAACNVGAVMARGDIIAVLTHDTVPSPGWLPPLVAALAGDDVGAAMPTIELIGRPGHFNTSGGALGYFGLAWVTDLGLPIPDEDGPVTVPFPSGAAFAMTKRTWDALGGFREPLFMYHEDTDLGWRLRMRGLRSVRVPASRVGHDYEFLRNPTKLALLERNRLYLLATNYRWSTTALLVPALAVVELGVIWMALRNGWLRAKLGTWPALFRMGSLRREYRAAQTGRVTGDAAIVASMATGVSTIAIEETRPPRGAAAIDVLLAGYLRLVLPIIRWLDGRRGLA